MCVCVCVCVCVCIPHRRVFSALTLCVFNKVVRNGTVCVCVCVLITVKHHETNCLSSSFPLSSTQAE
mgnify:CR=1 FL=1